MLGDESDEAEEDGVRGRGSIDDRHVSIGFESEDSDVIDKDHHFLF